MQAGAASSEQYALANPSQDGLKVGGGSALLGDGRNAIRLGTGDAGDIYAAPPLETESAAYLDRSLESRAQQGPVMMDAGPQNLYGGNAGGQLAFKKGDFVLPGEVVKTVEQIAKEAPKLAPLIEGAASLLGKVAVGAELLFHTDNAPTTDWTAAGAKFSHNQDDLTLRITDGETGTRVAVPGIHNPSQYSDAQYLSYVSYKANGGKLGINDFVSFDPPAMGSVDRASSQKPEWLKRLDAGNAFNKDRAGIYDFDEVYINKPSGQGYFRVDSYNPRTDEIISRKFTQFSEIAQRTGMDYVNEMTVKYPSGSMIADVPSNRENGLAGKLLTGSHVLEVPVQTKPIPQAILDAANRAGVLIRDINGRAY